MRRIDDLPEGPIQRPDRGEPPYPETMNQGAVDEITSIDPAAVIVKGDLTPSAPRPSSPPSRRATACSAIGCTSCAGNHDAYGARADGPRTPGSTCPASDRVDGHGHPRTDHRRPPSEQIEWLDAHAATADRPVIVMGHHQQWIEGNRSDDYFGLHPDSSDALAAVIERRAAIVAVHGRPHAPTPRPTHGRRRAVRRDRVCEGFPGTWAEYRVYEGGIMQVGAPHLVARGARVVK